VSRDGQDVPPRHGLGAGVPVALRPGSSTVGRIGDPALDLSAKESQREAPRRRGLSLVTRPLGPGRGERGRAVWPLHPQGRRGERAAHPVGVAPGEKDRSCPR
jgi:hypothetical protein